VSGEIAPRLRRGTVHEDLGRRTEIRMASDRAFGLVMATACGLAGLWPLFHGKPVRAAAMDLGAAFGALALLRPVWLHPLNRLWTALAAALSRVTTPVVCGLLFYLVVTPLAYAMRLSGKDPLRLRGDANRQSYWVDRPPRQAPARESMRQQF